MTIQFRDLDVDIMPSAISSSTLKRDGIIVGEGVVKRRISKSKYEVSVHGNHNVACRPVYNVGENILPTGIPVFVVIYNGDGWIVGRLRPLRDEDADDGEVTDDQPTTIGTAGDSTLRPHATDDSKNTAEVTVTSGNVVKMRASSATNFTMHPIGERIIQRCQTLLSFSDAYRIESGRKTGKSGGIVFDALTEETYKTKVGPSRTEVRVRNGKVDGSTVHQLSVDELITGGGTTTGFSNFQWKLDEDGTWDIVNCKEVNVGDSVDEPIVLGAQLVALLKGITTEMSAIRSAVSAYMTAVGSVATTVAATPPVPPPPPGVLAKALAAAIGPAAMAAGPQVSASAANVQALVLQYLTSAGITNEAILSDFFNTQKSSPFPGIISE